VRQRFLVAVGFLFGELAGALVELGRHFRRLFRRATQSDEQRCEFELIQCGLRSGDDLDAFHVHPFDWAVPRLGWRGGNFF